GKYKLPGLSVSALLMGRRIKDFRIEVILMNMQPCMMYAVLCNARPGHFTETVDVETVDMKDAFDLFSHFFCPWLSSVDTGLQLQTVHCACFLKGFGKIQRVGRGTCKRCRSKIFHAHHLSFRISCRHRDCCCAERFRTEVQAHAAGEQPISIAYMDNILCCEACHHKPSCDTLPPHIHIFLR